jgi:putative nucleotidyltransferase with HDIG domain
MEFDEASVRQSISKLKDLPTLPQVAAKVMQVVSNPMTAASDLNEVISVDQALTAKVLRLANSAYYGFPQEITTLTQAVVILGFNTIRNLALSVSVHKMLFEGGDQGLFSFRDFWKHSVGTAIAAKMLAKKVGLKSEENAFTAGLMHDIGKNFFHQRDHAAYLLVLRRSLEAGLPLWRCERESFGMDHAQVGGWMAEKWNLPADLCRAIARHHEPDPDDSQGVLTAVVHVGTQMCRRLPVGSSGDCGPMDIEPALLALLGLNEGSLIKLADELAAALKEAQSFLVLGAATKH